MVAIDSAARPTARGGAGVIDQHRLGDQSLDPNDSELPIVHALWCFGLMVFRSDCARATSPEGHGPLTDTPPRVSIPDSFQVCASPIFRRSRCNPTRVRFSAVSSARLSSRPRDGVFSMEPIPRQVGGGPHGTSCRLSCFDARRVGHGFRNSIAVFGIGQSISFPQ